MAFGDLLATDSATNTASTTSVATSTGITVAAGDLVIVAVGLRADIATSGAVSIADSLSNTWNALNSTPQAIGTRQGVFAYSKITNAGTMTVTASWPNSLGGTVHTVIVVARYEGAFESSPLDANPAVTTYTTGTSLDAPATGTLSQADELVVSCYANGSGDTASATSPMTTDVTVSTGGGAGTEGAGIASKVVASTATTTPNWTIGTSGPDFVIGTASFMKGVVLPGKSTGGLTLMGVQ